MELTGETEESAEVKIRRGPGEPTSREWEEHEAAHIPYRVWCRHCVRARGVNHPQRQKGEGNAETEERARRVPSLDGLFLHGPTG